MVAVIGTYQNGYVKLDREYPSDKPIKVIVTFLEEVEVAPSKGLTMGDFSFSRSRQALSDYNGSFGDAVAEERRSEA